MAGRGGRTSIKLSDDINRELGEIASEIGTELDELKRLIYPIYNELLQEAFERSTS